MKIKKYVLQEGEKDCGVACLYNIIRFYNGNINKDTLRNMLNVDKGGTSIYDIVSSSNKLGLKSSAYECELNDLCNLSLPVIAHIKFENKYDHFVIVDKIIDDEIIIFDPIRGQVIYEMEDFENEWSNIIITFEKTDNIVKEKEENFLINIFKYIFKNYKIIIFVFIISLLVSNLSLLNSLYLSYLYNNTSNSFKIFILFLFLCIFKMILDYLRNRIILKSTLKFDETITNDTYKKILSLPISYHHNRPVGDIVSRFNDLSNVKEFINMISFSIIIDLLYILIICIVLFIINKILFFLLFIIVIIYTLIYLLFRNKIFNLSYLLKENSSHVSSFLVESLFAIDTIKNLNIEKNIINDFYLKYKNLLNNHSNFEKNIILYKTLEDFISNISLILLLYIGILFYIKKIVNFTDLIIFYSLIVNLFLSLKNIISLDNIFLQSKNAYKRLKALFNENNDMLLPNNKIKNISNIKFSNLNYSYNKIKNIINNVNFSINENDKIFVSGKSGTGKSTIFKILTKQLNCDNNMVKINGIDINNISKDDILNNICFVSQNEYIFTDTILNNIDLYKKAAKKEIDKVIRITNIDKILEKRNITLDFLLEENGHNLSGGERQRIILARSLLQNRKVLILDETMNELDVSSERDILKKIITEYKITLILISHRNNNSDLFNKKIKIGGTL